VREERVQAEVATAFTHHLPKEIAAARAAGAHEPPGRTSVTVPAVYAATPRVLITRWLDGAPLSALLDGRTDLLPEGWRELGPGDAADLAARLLGHAIYAPAACYPETTVLATDRAGGVRAITSHAPAMEGGIAVAPASFGRYDGDL
jgi:hypothetical protein